MRTRRTIRKPRWRRPTVMHTPPLGRATTGEDVFQCELPLLLPHVWPTVSERYAATLAAETARVNALRQQQALARRRAEAQRDHARWAVEAARKLEKRLRQRPSAMFRAFIDRRLQQRRVARAEAEPIQ